MANPLGRLRKPTAQRQLEGNRSRRDIPPDLPLSGRPEWLGEAGKSAKEHFAFVAAELGACGVVKRLDTAALSVLAELWEKFWMASKEGDFGNMVKLAARWEGMGARFGLTPADRAKIMAGVAEQKSEKESRHFKVTG